jgi:hypothetical protein
LKAIGNSALPEWVLIRIGLTEIKTKKSTQVYPVSKRSLITLPEEIEGHKDYSQP